jgi:DNA invertase Pin-like site-specific DNA recombinase
VKTTPVAPAAYSYIRFSTPAQAEGDSLRRQTERAAAYCQRRGWRLDTSLTLHDLGVSARRGKNATVGNLRVFLDAIKAKKVLPGSVLIVESFDRITRQGIDEGYDLVKSILKADVQIVTLSPEREFDRDATRSLSKGALEIQLILERAAEESERKSDRLGAVWAEKRKRARAAGEVLTHQLPAWVEERGGKLHLVPGRAAIVRRIYQMAADGYGHRLTAKRLIAEGVPHFVHGGRWSTSYVNDILTDRRALGEFQPCTRGKPDGDPIPNYYPAAVTEEEWLRARAGAAQRFTKRGRVSKHLNVFAGLVRNALEGDSYYASLRPPSHGRGASRRLLVNSNWSLGRTSLRSFPLDSFERAILSALAELNPRDLLPQSEGRDEAVLLGEQLEGVKAELADAAAFMEANGFSLTIGKRVKDLEDRRDELAAKLVDAQARAACPAAEAWQTFSPILSVLDDAPDPEDARMRLRTALRRIVDGIWLLVVPRGHDRLAVAQVWFAGGQKHRDYLILHRPPKSNGKAQVEGGWAVKSAAHVTKAAGLDLRKREDAHLLEETLAAVDLPAVPAFYGTVQ